MLPVTPRGCKNPPIAVQYRRDPCKIAGVRCCFNPFRSLRWSSPDPSHASRTPSHPHPRPRLGACRPAIARRLPRKPLGLWRGPACARDGRSAFRRARGPACGDRAESQVRVCPRAIDARRALALPGVRRHRGVDRGIGRRAHSRDFRLACGQQVRVELAARSACSRQARGRTTRHDTEPALGQSVSLGHDRRLCPRQRAPERHRARRRAAARRWRGAG